MTKPTIIRGPVTRTEDGIASEIWYLRCPGCNLVATADKDQMQGRVSILCECGYHETHRLIS